MSAPGVKLKETPYLQWEIPREWYPDDSHYKGEEKRFRPFKFWEMIERFVFAAYESASLLLVLDSFSARATKDKTIVSWKGMRLVSPLAAEVLTIKNGTLNLDNQAVKAGVCLYVHARHPIETATVELCCGSADEARKKGRVPVGVVRDSQVYLRPSAQRTVVLGSEEAHGGQD